jgi:DNA-binding CsgD family transcriptional regulator
VLCPELVGRDEERVLLRARVDGLGERRGGVVVLVGEAGVGKSRLARDAVDAAVETGLPVLSGRAVPGSSPLPYRPLAEAFLAAFRSTAPPDDPALEGFRGHLARLVPAWRTDSGAEESPVLVAEAVVRLLAVEGAQGGCVLVVEDLHWADAETLAVLDYLADALQGEPVLCLGTARPSGAAADLIDRLGRRDPAAVVPVEPLDEIDVDTMVAACLGFGEPPPRVRDLVRAASDGSPFLVEELLAGLVASDELRLDEGRWVSEGDLTPTVPASLRDSIGRRLDALTPTARRVLAAAALLGRSFDWELLPGVAEVDGATVVEALRAAVGEQLVEVDGDRFRFRHALTCEAVRSTLLPPERREIARRAWPAHELAHPGLPGPTLELAADLAEAAGEPAAAARHLSESSRRALTNGALVTAESTARRAVRLAAGQAPASFDADEVLLNALLAAGKPTEALAVGRPLAERLAAVGAPAARRADLLIVTAHAALTAGDGPGAAGDLAAARGAAGDAADPALRARLDALGAAVALDRADLTAAQELAQAAADGAAATAQPQVECEALLVLGQVVRTVEGVGASVPWYERAGAVAARAGLAQMHLRAQQELALVGWSEGDVQPLHDVRELAVHYGAMVTVAVMDLSLAAIALTGYDRDACLTAATACVDASRRYGLATLPVANLWLAGAHALRGDAPAMEAAIAAALAPDPDDPRFLADLYGHVLTTRAFVDDELDRLPGLVDTMIEHVRLGPPTTSVYPGRILWALLHTIEDDDLGEAAREEFAAAAHRVGLPLFRCCGELIEAVALGRRGDKEAAAVRFEAAYQELLARHISAGSIHSYVLLAARAALRDGWGDPIRWLREAEAFFAAGDYGKLARRCRTMLGEAGAPVPRRGRGSVVPPSLRALGVTSRELDVIQLVIEGRSNKQIAAELFVSPKTVERHLSNLFARLDVSSRQELAERALTHLGGTNA